MKLFCKSDKATSSPQKSRRSSRDERSDCFQMELADKVEFFKSTECYHALGWNHHETSFYWMHKKEKTVKVVHCQGLVGVDRLKLAHEIAKKRCNAKALANFDPAREGAAGRLAELQQTLHGAAGAAELEKKAEPKRVEDEEKVKDQRVMDSAAASADGSGGAAFEAAGAIPAAGSNVANSEPPTPPPMASPPSLSADERVCADGGGRVDAGLDAAAAAGGGGAAAVGSGAFGAPIPGAAPPIGVAKNYSNAGHIIRMDAYLSLVKDAQNDR